MVDPIPQHSQPIELPGAENTTDFCLTVISDTPARFSALEKMCTGHARYSVQHLSDLQNPSQVPGDVVFVDQEEYLRFPKKYRSLASDNPDFRFAIVCDADCERSLPGDINALSYEALLNTSPAALPPLVHALALRGFRLGFAANEAVTQSMHSVTETLQRFFESPLLGMLRLAPDGMILEANKTFETLLSLPPGSAPGNTFLQYVHMRMHARVRSAFEELNCGICGTTQVELRCQYESRSSRYCIASFARVSDSAGAAQSILVALLDITERREAEKQLQNKEAYLRQVIDIIPHLVFAKDRNGRYTLVNQQVARLFGREVSDIIGKFDRDINPFPQEYERFATEDARVFSEGAHIVIPEEPLHHLSSDSIRWYQTIKKPLRTADGVVTEVVGVASDMTERRRAEQALRAIVSGTVSKTAQEFFSSLVQHLAEVLDTRFAFLARIDDGTTEAHILALWEDGHFHERIRYDIRNGPTDEIFGKEIRLFETHVTDTFPEDSFLREQGIQSYMGAPIFSSSGAPIGVLAVMDTRPMTEWPPAQSILKLFAERAGAELDRIAVEQQTEELQRQLLQSQKMEAIGQLAAGIAHDLNNALGAVVGHLQLIQSSRGYDSSVGSSVSVALNGCERATSLIEQLLGFSRQGRYNLETVSLRKLIEDTVTFLSRIIGKGVSIQVKENQPDIFIHVDPAQLQQAITNILINATQAMPEGGVICFELDTEQVEDPRRFNFKAAPGLFARIAIRDTGTGIPANILEKIFEPFFSTKTESLGTGLGLAMVYGTMQNHGGWVRAESTIGDGTTFTLFIPVSDKQAEASIPLPPEVSCSNPTGQILVIDDEPYLVELALTFLKRNNMRGIGFTDPRKAVEWYAQNHSDVDLAVLDMKMPDMTGSDCFDALLEIDPDTRAVILSGFIHDEAAQRVLDRGALHFFQKPLKYPDLVKWIQEFLARSAVDSSTH